MSKVGLQGKIFYIEKMIKVSQGEKMHDLFCKRSCYCGMECYGHPDYLDKEHLCEKHGTYLEKGFLKALYFTLIWFPLKLISFLYKNYLTKEFNAHNQKPKRL